MKMNIVMDIKTDEKIDEDSVIVFENGCWTAKPKRVFLGEISRKLTEIDKKLGKMQEQQKEDVTRLEGHINTIANAVGE